MEIVITIQHPAHVHFFKNVIWELQERGHKVQVYMREKDVAQSLLENLGIEYEVLAGSVNSIKDYAFVQTKYELNLYRKVREFQPEILMAIGEPGITHVAKLTGAKSILFVDTEHSKLQKKISIPFADQIYTPESFEYDLGRNHVRYPGYHELAYLHPDRFKPNPAVFDTVDVNKEDKIVILRLVGWQAVHDIRDSGFKNVSEVVSELNATGAQVLITSEADLPAELEEYRANVPVHRMHDLMYYSDLFIGESGTMACESAVLGTPSIFVNTLSLGYLNELEKEYGLVYNYSSENRHKKALRKAVSLLKNNDSRRWEKRRDKMLQHKHDTTEFILDQIN